MSLLGWPLTILVRTSVRLGERINIVQLTGFDHRSDDSPVLGAGVRACEQRIFPIQRDRTDSAFDGIVVELDGAIIDEARQARPAPESA
jgi:hypothetical protein